MYRRYPALWLTEGVANISENAEGILTVDEDFSCVEFKDASEENEYRIIGTTLTNYTMPLIRYDTGDLAQVSMLGKHNHSGRIVDDLCGRNNEYVLLPTGVKVGSAAISLILNRFQEIKETQIIQKAQNSISVQVVLSDSNIKVDEHQLTSALRERFGREMKIHIEYVSTIPKTKNGKLQLVLQELDI